MPRGLNSNPRILRGAFVEYGLSVPPLTVVFQFNPEQLSRNRSLTFDAPGGRSSPPREAEEGQSLTGGGSAATALGGGGGLRKFHRGRTDLGEVRDAQIVTIQEESISFEIRLDATDKLNEGDLIAAQYGIAPQLATLELMVLPKDEGFIAHQLRRLAPGAFSFTKTENPPLILFIWGRKRVLPVNIDSLNITETEFSPDLNPIRATASVGLTVIEGPNPAYTYSKAMQEAMSVLNLANLPEVTDVVIPG